jgi:hypothetical protein
MLLQQQSQEGVEIFEDSHIGRFDGVMTFCFPFYSGRLKAGRFSLKRFDTHLCAGFRVAPRRLPAEGTGRSGEKKACGLRMKSIPPPSGRRPDSVRQALRLSGRRVKFA